jgi:glycosyltransferase involved in cell wall biosynthesis
MPLRFGYVGALAPHKGIHVLVEAFRKVVDARPGLATLSIHGSTGWLPRYVSDLRHAARGYDIDFPGEFRHQDVAAIYRELDVLVVPSLWWENAPLTIQEAAQAGIPVLGSNLGGTAEFIARSRNGLLFERGSASELAYAMMALIDDPDLWRALARGGAPPRTIESDAADIEARYRAAITARLDRSTAQLEELARG